jgi:Mg-chelatase subunit ChlD
MRALPLVALLIVCAGCPARVQPHPALNVAIDAALRAEVRVQAEVEVEAEVEAEPEGEVQVEAEIPVPVELEGAAVVEFFGIPLEGVQDVVFVLDRSGSMNGRAQDQIAHLGVTEAAPAEQPAADDPQASTAPPPTVSKIDVAHAELTDALERLPAGTRMNVLYFNRYLDAYAPTLVPLEESAREDLIGFVRSIDAWGPTALGPAMRAAFLMNPRRIVLLSDGRGNIGGDSRSVLRDAREALRGGVRIDTVGLGRDQDVELLRTLAAESGGIYQAF